MSSESIVMGALLADAICLGPHWVYAQGEIAAKISRADRFQDPISPYHPGKKAGDFTHYGDQVMVLLRYLAEAKRFDLAGYVVAWRAYWENPATISYRDGATKGTLANLEAGLPPERAGAVSHDFAGISNIGALLLLDWPDDAAAIGAAKELTAFTHNDPAVIAAAGFFMAILRSIQSGSSVREAMDDAGSELEDETLLGWLGEAWESANSLKPDVEALADLGLSCNIDGAFAGVWHLLLRYADDPLTALVENAKAGGDSSARGMVLGSIYGAADLLGKLPAEWTEELKAREEILEKCRVISGQ